MGARNYESGALPLSYTAPSRPGRTRTCNPPLKRRLLYRIELRAVMASYPSDSGSRLHPAQSRLMNHAGCSGEALPSRTDGESRTPWRRLWRPGRCRQLARPMPFRVMLGTMSCRPCSTGRCSTRRAQLHRYRQPESCIAAKSGRQQPRSSRPGRTSHRWRRGRCYPC